MKNYFENVISSLTGSLNRLEVSSAVGCSLKKDCVLRRELCSSSRHSLFSARFTWLHPLDAVNGLDDGGDLLHINNPIVVQVIQTERESQLVLVCGKKELRLQTVNFSFGVFRFHHAVIFHICDPHLIRFKTQTFTYLTHCHINRQHEFLEVQVVVPIQVKDTENVTGYQGCVS